MTTGTGPPVLVEPKPTDRAPSRATNPPPNPPPRARQRLPHRPPPDTRGRACTRGPPPPAGPPPLRRRSSHVRSAPMPPQRHPSGGEAPAGNVRGTRNGPSPPQQTRLAPMSAQISPRSLGDGAGQAIAGATDPDFARHANAPSKNAHRSSFRTRRHQGSKIPAPYHSRETRKEVWKELRWAFLL